MHVSRLQSSTTAPGGPNLSSFFMRRGKIDEISNPEAFHPTGPSPLEGIVLKILCSQGVVCPRPGSAAPVASIARRGHGPHRAAC